MTSAQRSGYSINVVMQKKPSKKGNLYGIFSDVLAANTLWGLTQNMQQLQFLL